MHRLSRFLIFVTLILSRPNIRAAENQNTAADLIVYNGRIVTVDGRFHIAEAFAVKNGRVLAVGTSSEILEYAKAGTERLDLGGKTVLPGLIDSHTHPVSASMTEANHAIPAMESIADVLSYFRERSKVVPKGEWIVLQQVFITRLREQRYPTRAELDAAAPEHAAIFRTGPDASLNSRAMKLAGINRDFQIPSGVAGRIERDAQGEPTGILRNFANYIDVPGQEAKHATESIRQNRLKQMLDDYLATGLTSICDRDASPADLELYKGLRDRQELAIRVAISHHIDTLGPISDIESRIKQVAANPLFLEKDPMLRIIGVKTYLDGGMLTGSAYMREPWGVSQIYAINDPQYRGVLFIPKDRLLPIVRATLGAGLQFTAHSVGDGAVHTLLDVYDELSREHPIRDLRPCITHANFLSREAISQAARLGVLLDIQPAWLYLDSRTLVQQFGYDRLRYFQPLRSLFEAGVIAGGGSDHMQKIGSLRSINPYNPFLGMWITLSRQARWYEGQIHPEETLTREQAIRFYTVNNAILTFAEDKTGSIETGKLADFIIVDRDVLKCALDDLRDTQVLETFVGGKRVYRSRKKG